MELKWSDRQTASFGPFESEIISEKKPFRYTKGDVIIGCGGYDKENSYLIFSKITHSADHGAAKKGGVIGKIVSGRSVLERWKIGDSINSAERIISREDTKNAFVTKDRNLVLETGMEIISYVSVIANGYSNDKIDTSTSESVEHMLLTFSGNEFAIDLNSSVFAMDERMKKSIVKQEAKKSRLEGTVTVRTSGKQIGSIYIYTKDIPGSPNHTVTGQINHGIELVKLAARGDKFTIKTTPEQIDLRGLAISKAIQIAEERGIKVTIDGDADNSVVTDHSPKTTLEILDKGEVRLLTVPLSNVITIRLDDENAPRTCGIFREVTGLRWYKIGKMPMIFKFEDVYLFNPKVSTKITITNENTPKGEVPANTLAMTNDSRKSAGMVGMRMSPNSEFGPTSEPLPATNIIGEVIESEKLKDIKEGDIVYLREME